MMRLSLGHQAVLVMRVRDLRLAQYALTDRAANAEASGDTATAGFLLEEADVIRTCCNDITAVLRVAAQDAGIADPTNERG